jgi:heparanase 1
MIPIWKLSVKHVALLALTAGATSGQAQSTPSVALAPASMKQIGGVDERYQSYNIEMLEITGGKFWKPYKDIHPRQAQAQSGTSQAPGRSDAPAGMSPDLYQYRPPLDLANQRLRAMAKALAPAYVRISGTWANTTYFADTDTPPKAPPEGYEGVLTRKQWLGAIDFSRAVDAPIVTSVPIGQGTRGADGVWQPDQTAKWLAFTQAHGGTIAPAEYFNEPTLASMGGAPKSYDSAAFGRDFQVFDAFMRKNYPNTKLLGPGSVGEADAPWAVAEGGYAKMQVLPAGELAASTGDADAFSYHHYGAVSQRCAAMGHQTSADQALTEDWLGRTDVTLAYYRVARDKSMPGKPFWNTETGETACGGNPWAGTFLDTFRYLDQLGRLARQQVTVVIHNTLDASDYSLLDETTFQPKPDFWGALLWRRLMGTKVLDAGVTTGPGFHVYAQCLRNAPGGVALLVLNTDRQKNQVVTLPMPAQRYTLTSAELTGKTVALNGTPLQLAASDALPNIKGQATATGPITISPVSITFVAIPDAQNQACRN